MNTNNEPTKEEVNQGLQSALIIDGSPVRLSSSGADKWNSCKRAWYGRYVAGEPDDSSEASLLGTYVHSALEAFYTGGDRSTKALKEYASANWDGFKQSYCADIQAGKPLSPVEELKLKQAVWEALDGIAHLENPSTVNVIENEMAIDTFFRGLPLRGFIDRVDRLPDGTVGIVDFKTGKVPKDSKYYTKKLQQLFLYGMVLKDMGMNPSIGKLYFTTHKTIIQSDINKASIGKVKSYLDRTVDEMYEAAETKEFPPSPSPLCGWCKKSADGSCPEGQNMVLSLGAKGKLRFDAPAFKWIKEANYDPLPPESGYYYEDPLEREYY